MRYPRQPGYGAGAGRAVLVAGVLCLLAAGPSRGQTAPETERLGTALGDLGRRNPVVARVEDEDIRWAEVVASARDLPDEYRDNLEAIAPALVERLIDLRLLARAAREAGLDEDPAIRRQVRAVEDRLITDAFVEREIAARVTPRMIEARYQAYVADVAGRTQVRARHILLDNERDAIGVIALLDEGVEFERLARERSLGPSAERGGDLDYVTRDSMAPAFADAAFSLEVGSYSRTPVRTRFGWHVIKVEDRRGEPPRPLAEIREELRQDIIRGLLDERIRGLRARAEIELFPADHGVD